MIFVDTSVFLALLSKRDRNHGRAVRAFEEFDGKKLNEFLLTTNHVVLETITIARYRGSHSLAVGVGEILLEESLARIQRTTLDEERAAFEYLKRHPDKKYSALDCLSFVVMDTLGIREALAFDEDFAHRFILRPGPE